MSRFKTDPLFRSLVLQPQLISATEKVVYRYSFGIEQPTPIFRLTDYTSVDNITSLGMHKEKDLIFLGDSSGTIRRLNISTSNQIKASKTIFRGKQDNNVTRITQISVDWLNNFVYFASDSKISRVDLTGDLTTLQDLVVGFDDGPARTGLEGPFNVQVDPVNGYLLWSLKGTEKGGIYRLDLISFNGKSQSGHHHHLRGSDKDDKEPIHYQTVPLLIREPDIPVFTLDYLGHKILFPRTTASGVTIVSYADGKHEKEERNQDNINKSLFSNFKDMVYLNNLIYWTNGTNFYREEYHAMTKTYYHTEFNLPSVQGDIVSCLLFDQQLQPTPIPKTTVTELTAVLSDTTANVNWHVPNIMAGQGHGAWNSWLYEIAVRNATAKNDTLQDNLKDLHTRIIALSPDTEYVFKVRAYSKAGKGPWSTPVMRQTKKRREVPGSSVPETPNITIDASRNTITWTRSASRFGEAVEYELMLRDTDDAPNVWKSVYNGTLLYWYVSNVAQGKNYNIRVRAVSQYGESEWSPDKNFYYAPAENSNPAKQEHPSSGHNVVIPFLACLLLFILVIPCIYYFIDSGMFCSSIDTLQFQNQTTC